MADIRLAKPAAGTTQTVPSAPDGRFIFDFPADAATLTRNGDDLVLTFEDGAAIQLQGFYTTYSKEEMPSFQVDGVEISGQDFFAALDEDLMPAAGPASGSSAARGGRYNEYGGSDLLDGIDHLGRLDIGFDGGTQLATDTVEPSPYSEVDHGVTVTPSGVGAATEVVTVYEAGLAGGSQAGEKDAPTMARGSLSINAPDGVASIVIGGVVVFENGALTGKVVSTDEGTLSVTGYDSATGKLDFSYSLDRNTTEHVKSDPATDTQISHDLTVTVTDTDGDSASTTITVNVVDDAPTIGAPGEASMEVDESGEASHQAKVDINDFLTVDAGADGEAGRTYKLTLGEGAGENLQAIVDGQVYDIELTLNEEGNRISGTAEGEEIFYVSVDEKGEVYLSLTGNGSLKHPDSTSADEGLKLEDIGVQVTVTDGDGDEKSVDVNLDLTIKDDGPTVTVTQGNDAQYGQEVKIGTLDSDYGADGENTLEALQLQIDGKIGVLSNGVYTFAGIGSVRIGEDGQIFFTPLADSGADRDYTLQVTVTDGDDDKDTDSISFRVEGTDLAGVKGSVTGDDANVLTKQTVDVEIPTEQLEALGATLVPNQEVPVMDAQDDVYGKLYVNEDGKVTFVQTKAYTGHMEPDQPDELADGFSGKLKVTLADGTPSSITVDVSIRDDAPVEPGKIDFMTLDGAGNYDDNSLVILFTIGATPGNTKLEDLKFGADVGGEDAPAMLTVKVNGMEFSIEVTRDEDGQLHFSRDDGDTITFTGPEDTGKYGSLSYDKETGIFTYTRPEGDIGGEKNSYDISLTITDADGDAVTVSEDYETVFREPTVIGDTVTTDEGKIIMGGALIGSGGETEVTAPVGNTAQGSITVNLDHADGTIVIESPSSKSITITIDKNGDIVEIGNEVIQGKHGYISDVHVSSVTPDGTIKIDYTYTLNTPVDGGNQDNGRGEPHLADEFTVTVTTDGGSATGTITANALDDAPVLEIDPLEPVYDTADTIEIPLEKFSVGADVISLAGKTASISVMVGEKEYIFTVSHETNGTYSFTAPDTQDGNLKIVSTGDGGYKIVYTRDGNDISDGVNDSYQFNVTVTDSDGDTATGSVTVDAEVIPPIIDESIHTDLRVDEDGLVHDTGKTDTGQLVVDMHGQAGTVSIGIATVTVGTDGQVVWDGQPVTGGYGNLTITGATLDDGRLTIEYSYDLTKSFTDETGNDGTNTVQDADSFPILINGEAEGSVTVDIVDDVPTLTVSEPEVVESVPDDDNLASGEDVDFVSENKTTNINNAGKAVDEDILSKTNADWEDVTIYAAHVDYEKMEDGSYAISGEIERSGNYKLEYSQYPKKEKNFADFGLMVRNEGVDNPLTDNAAGGFETNAFVKNGELTGSEAIVIDLGGKTAYGVSLDFGAFYSNFKGNEGQEHVLVTFYKDGKPVGSRVIDAVQNEGGQAVVVHSDQFLSEGFDQVVISALQNTGGKTGQASTFTIQGVGLITAPEPIHQVTGEIAVDSGADGYHAETGEDGTTTSNDFTQAHVRFDMPETLTIETEDGSVELTLEIRTDSAGNSLLTGSADGKEYFSVILEQQEDGSWSWKMDQYEEFLVWGEDGQLGSLELGFITRDGDDDEATGKVDIPLKNLPDLTASETTLVTDESYIADLGSSTEPAEGGDGQATSNEASGTLNVKTYGKEGTLTLTINSKDHTFQLDADGKLSGTSEELAVTTTYGTLTLTNGEAGKITYIYTQTQPYSHTPGEGPDQSREAESFTVQVKADGEMSDPATITVSIEDDAPVVTVEEGVSAQLEVTETGTAFMEASTLFDVNYGADGKKENTSPKYELTYDTSKNPGLTAIVGGQEEEVTLQLEGGILKGMAGEANIFTISVDESTGKVTLEMTGAGSLKHDGSNGQELHLEGVGVKVTVTDGDDDSTTSDSADLTLTITDDVPTISESQQATITPSSEVEEDIADFDFDNAAQKNDAKWVPKWVKNQLPESSDGQVYDHPHEEWGVYEDGYKKLDLTQENHKITFSAAVVQYQGSDGMPIRHGDQDDAAPSIQITDITDTIVGDTAPLLTFVSTAWNKGESGMAVYSGQRGHNNDQSDGEIGAINGQFEDGNTDWEAVKMDLGADNAYSITITLNSFYNTQGDQEKAYIILMNDDKVVDKLLIEGKDAESGIVDSTKFSSAEAFNTVYIVPWGTKSDFLLNGVEVGYSPVTVLKSEGQVEAVSADGIKGYSFGYDQNDVVTVNEKKLTVSVEGDGKTIHFLSSSGDDDTYTKVIVGEATITEAGKWTLNWFDQATNPQQDTDFTLPIIATDGDGDTAEIKVKVVPSEDEVGDSQAADALPEEEEKQPAAEKREGKDGSQGMMDGALLQSSMAAEAAAPRMAAATLLGMALVADAADDVLAAATGTDGMPHADVKADGLSSDIGDAPSTLHMDGAAQSGADAFDATLDSSLFAPGVMDPLADGTESLEGLLPDKEHAPFDAEGLLFTAAAPDLSDDASGLVGKGVASGDVLPPAGEEGILGTEETDVLTGTDDDDILLGGDGDEQIFGGSGDDYIDGGEGRDTIYAGDGNDIIVYDKADYLVSGGSGIDFMVSADSTLTMDTLLSGGKDGHEGPIVDSIEVLITGKDALSLTSIQELADKYGIELGTNPDGQETLTLDMGKWTEQADGSYDFHGGAEEGGLTLETNLQHDSTTSSDNGEMAQQVFILEHTNS